MFTQLTVFDNLLLAGYGMPRRERAAQVEEALAFFPEIAAKRNDRAVTLSGGQQQMLAVAQGLVRRPRLLMLDEPSAGLSPVLVDRVLAAAGRLRDAGTAVLLVEQLIEKALALADRVYALARGSIVLEAAGKKHDCRAGWSMHISARASRRERRGRRRLALLVIPVIDHGRPIPANTDGHASITKVRGPKLHRPGLLWSLAGRAAMLMAGTSVRNSPDLANAPVS